MISSNLLGKVQFESACKERHIRKEMYTHTYIYVCVYKARYRGSAESVCMRDLILLGTLDGIVFEKERGSRRGNDNDRERLSKARHVKPVDVRLLLPRLRCWRKRTTFPRFPANFVENGAYDFFSSQAKVRAFDLRNKKGGDKEEVKKEQDARAINPFVSSGTL